jgi:hypothetical protein
MAMPQALSEWKQECHDVDAEGASCRRPAAFPRKHLHKQRSVSQNNHRRLRVSPRNASAPSQRVVIHGDAHAESFYRPTESSIPRDKSAR